MKKMMNGRYASGKGTKEVAIDRKLLVFLKRSDFFDKLYCFNDYCFIANVIVNIAAVHTNMRKMVIRQHGYI